MTIEQYVAVMKRAEAKDVIVGPGVVEDEALQASLEAEKLGLKAAAQLLLSDHLKRIIVPSPFEWVGLHFLDSDGEI